MRVAILGAGAMGSVYGARFSMAGADVTLLDVNQAHLDAIKHNGLQVSLDDGDHRLNMKACRPEDFSEGADLIVLFTKIFHTADALSAISDRIGNATVLSLQNGIGNAERVSAFVPMSQILVGMTMTPAEFDGPGKVSSHGAATTDFYSANGDAHPAINSVHELMQQGGIEAQIQPEIETAIWEKATFNCAMNSICSLARVPVGAIGRLQAAHQLALRVVHEVYSVALAKGLSVDVQKIEDMVAHAIANHINHEPSMLQDLSAGRRTEIDALNGAIVEIGASLDVPTPINQTLTDLVRLAEQPAVVA